MKNKRKIYRIKIGKLAFSVRIERFACSLAVVSMIVLFAIIGVVHIFSNKTYNDNNEVVSDNDTMLAEAGQSFVVCIDPGHGAYDEGGRSKSGVKEKDVDLKVGLKVGQTLEENNIKVVYTRKDDKTALGNNQKEDLKKRVQISTDSKANLFVSIHCNQYDDDDSVKGTELWCNEPNTKDETLAKTIQDELSKVKYTKARGIRYKKDTSLYVLSKNEAISALVEIGYLSNSSDCKFISSEEGQTKCAAAIAKAILEFKENISEN